MAILQGDEARAWIATNPGRKFKILSSPTQEPKEDGLFLSLLKGMVKYSPFSASTRDTLQNIKNVGLALGTERVEAPEFSNEQLANMGGSEAFFNRPEVKKYQEDLKSSQSSYSQLQSELANPTVNAAFNRIFNVSPEEQARQSGAQLYGITKEKPQGEVFSPAVNRGLVNALEVFLSAALAAGALPAEQVAKLSAPGRALSKAGSPLTNLGGTAGFAARTGANLVEGAMEGFAESTPENVGSDVLWSALTEAAFGVPGEVLGSIEARRAVQNMDFGDLNRKAKMSTILSDQLSDQDVVEKKPFTEALESRNRFKLSDLRQEPNIELKNDVVVRSPAGEKIRLSAGEAFTPYKVGEKQVILQDGGTYVIQAGDYQKALANSRRAIPQPVELPENVRANLLLSWDEKRAKPLNVSESEFLVDSVPWGSREKDFIENYSPEKLARKTGIAEFAEMDPDDKEDVVELLSLLDRAKNMTPEEMSEEMGLGIFKKMKKEDAYEQLKFIVGDMLETGYDFNITGLHGFNPELEMSSGKYGKNILVTEFPPKYERFMDLSGGEKNYREAVFTLENPPEIKSLKDLPSNYVLITEKDIDKYYKPRSQTRIEGLTPAEEGELEVSSGYVEAIRDRMRGVHDPSGKKSKYALIDTNRVNEYGFLSPPLSYGSKEEILEDVLNYKPFEKFSLRMSPEVKNWKESVADFVLKEAQRGDYDGIIWSSPQEVKSRYHLSKIAKGIEWEPMDSVHVSGRKAYGAEHWEEFPNSFANVLLADYQAPNGKKYLKILEAQSDVEMGKRAVPSPKSPTDKKVIINLKGHEDPLKIMVSSNGIVLDTPPDLEESIGKPLSDVVGTDLANHILKENRGSLKGKAIDIGGKWADEAYGENGIWAKQFTKKTGENAEVLEKSSRSHYIMGKWNNSKKTVEFNDPTEKIDWDTIHLGDILKDTKTSEKRIVVDLITSPGGENDYIETVPFDQLFSEEYPFKQYMDKKGELIRPIPQDVLDIPDPTNTNWHKVIEWREKLREKGLVKRESVALKGSEPVFGIRLTPEKKGVIAGKPPVIKTSGKKFTQEYLDELFARSKPVQKAKDYSYLGLKSAGDWKNIPTRNAGEFAITLAKEGKLKPNGKDIIMMLKKANIPLEGVDIGQIIARMKEVL